MRSKEVNEGISHLEMLLDYGILANEDEPHIKTVLNYIIKMEADLYELEQMLEMQEEEKQEILNKDK